ncbi:protein dopey-2-like [Sinocyclocheilus grahami]|uniref:protein dopey-2-like n=1 Tax=Sinocyclocheilus grahami TaxID=75366 RepID=UPI0007AC7A03|nr:PREDICTED: protein dopey-2-like [Sinocyclocheilus grahami]
MMDPEEAELLNDYRYRSYAAVIEKALRNFESSSEWADLISSLGKLNKALQSNLKYSLLPRRLIIGKRLAQCLHPALPSGVHLKALETYEVIFKIIGTKWLAKDLFIYSSGLFPLLGHAAMSLKPVLLTLYERYFLPLQRALLPSLQAFIMGLLPGLEEGAEVYERTDALLVKLSVLVGQSVFYGALWGSVLICPLVRLPASLFIVAHFDLSIAAREQKYMLGTDHRLVVKAVCLALQDSNVLVQRNMLEILLYFFPFTSCQDPEECAFPLKQDEVISVVSAASLTLLRRDMSLNRRLYAWMLGLDIKGGMVAADSSRFNTVEEYTAFYFSTHSRELLVQAVVNILKQKDIEANPDNLIEYLRPFRIILSLLDKSEIGPLVLSDVLLEVVRAFYSYCKVMLGEDSLNSSLSGSQLNSKIKENKNSSEIIKTVNMLVSAMSSNYLWDYMTRHFQICLSSLSDPAGKHPSKAWSSPPSVTELSTLIIFLMDVIPLELYAEIQTQCLPQILGCMLQSLRCHMTSLRLQELTQALRACFKVLSKIQMPVAYMDMEAESQTQDLEQTRIVMTGNNKVKETDQVNGNHDDSSSEVGLNGQERQEAEPGVVPHSALRSEDSGLGLSASPSEQHLLPGRNGSDTASGVNPEAEDVWRRGGTIENMSKCVQDILASVITRHLLDVGDPEKKKKQEAANQLDPNAPPRGSKRSPLKRKGSRDLGLIKDRLAEFFNPSKLRIHALHGSSRDKNHRPAVLEWMGNFQSKSKGEISESCRQVVTVVCQLLLECTTFPVYFTEEENQDLQTSMFNKTGIEGTLPDWLRSLMTLCCLTKDYQVQHVAISSLLELINHSQSLALVIQDKNQRYKNSDVNPLSGQLQMVTLPPIYPAVLKTLEDSTDFYLRVSQVLWAQLDTERREHHVSCVELFYRLHCLAPSASICEDIICLGLLSGDKVVCLEALHRFSVLWHLTREIQTNRSTSLNRSFDRSLFVVLDSLNNQDGSVSAAAQNWLVRALSLSDVVRILEPVLLLLLDPRTQRSPIQSVKQNLSVGMETKHTHTHTHTRSEHAVVQHVAISSLLELINHSQSLALVIQDKNQRYKNSDVNPLSGQLQMVTLPPIYPAVLKTLEDSTDFYLRVSQVLWALLDTERREHHVSCVELFYRLHCLAPSASICEDIICLGLLSGDKVVCLEALHRFSVLWHLTREIQTNRSTSLNRSFDRSLFVVLDSLNNQDGSVSAAAQNWLVRALSLSDVVRILEPVLLLLLDPRTQRSPIQSVKQNLSVGNLKALTWRDRSITKSAGDNMTPGCQTGESFVRRITIVDREALWAELERDPELTPPDSPTMSRSESEETEGEDEEVEEEEESEHTESADTSGTQNSTENSSSSAVPYLQHHDDGSVEEEGVTNGLQRVDSERTQVSDSLSSDEDDGQLEAIAKFRLLKRQREKREAVDSLFRHVLLYKQQYESSRILYAFTILETILRTSAGPFVEALSSTSLDCSSIAHLNLIQNLLQRHRQAQDGGSFYGRLQTSTPPSGATPDPSQTAFSPLHSPSSPSSPPTLLLELLTCLCMRYLRSHYPSYASIPTRQLQANREVQVKSVEVLTELMIQLVWVAQQAQIGEAKGTASLEAVHNLLWGYKVQQYVLLMLSASMYVCQRADRPDQHTLPEEDQGGDVGEISEESLINFGRDGIWAEHPLQIALLKLLKVLIVLEHHVCPPHTKAQDHDQSNSNPQQRADPSALAREWQTAVMFQQSIKAVRYVPSQPITAQGMFVSAAARALHPQYGCAMHPAWVTLLCEVLPYLGRSLAIIVSPIIAQICRNLDELVKQHEHDGIKASHNGTLKRENIAPDYPLTLLEGLTTITHYCLLDHRKTAAACDVPDLRNASNAILEEFPHMISSMALLWGVVKGCDSTHGSRASPTSVYFKGTKILRQKVLEFLMPLTQQFGVQVMTSVAAVWSSRKSRKRRSGNKILPDASDSQMTLVDLVKALNTLRTDTILQLIREVVKKPHQIRGDQKTTLVDIPVLQFSYVYIQSLTAQALQESINPLLSLLRESVQLNLTPPGHFLLLGILDDCVNRLPNIDNKRDTKELQEVSQRILEAVGAVAGSSLEQTSWLSRNLEVKAQPQVCLQGDEDDHDGNELEECAGQGSAMVSSSAPSVFSVQALVLLAECAGQGSAMVSSSAPSVFSVQALVLLAEVLAPLLDMVYRSDEKEKAVPLISRLMYYVFPYLKNHSAYNMPSFCAGAQLLSNLSGYAYTKRAWKKEVLELFMDPMFFTMESSCSCHWRSIIDHLLTHEKTMFKDLMSMQSNSLKLFNSAEQKPMLLKRQAFAMFSGENDQYHFYLPLIQERLTENLRVGQTPSVSAQMFLMFRVLLLRISPQHLTSLWPIMVTELMRIFNRLEKTLLDDKEVSKSKLRGGHDKNGLLFPQAELDMYLSACKFLDTAVSFPPEHMPLFQMYRWAFIPEVDVDHYDGPGNTLLEGEQECKPHIVRILDGINRRYGQLNGTAGESNTDRVKFPLLTLRSLCSVVDLVPFFSTLCCSFNGSSVHLPHYVADYPPSSSDQVMKRLEHIIEGEFLDGMDN